MAYSRKSPTSAQFPGIAFGIATQRSDRNGLDQHVHESGNFPGATATQLDQAAQLYATLTGRVSSITRNLVLSETTHQYQQGIAPIDRDHLREGGLFAQDVWRAAPNLTVTLGLRYEKQFAFQNLTAPIAPLVTRVSGAFPASEISYKPGTLTGISPTYDNSVPLSGAYKIPGVPAPSIGVGLSVARA